MLNKQYTHKTVLNNVIALKTLFRDKFGEAALWNKGEYSNHIEYWASAFPEYHEMFAPLIVNEHNDFVLFRYNLLDTDAAFWEKYNGMYRDCRSSVIDIKNECFVLLPFRKFFNLNECAETQEKEIRARMETAKRIEFSEKLDGSMQSARYYNGTYVLAGSQALDPKLSFRVDIGYKMLSDEYKKMLRENAEYTFIFEFIHKSDAHVVAYTEKMEGLHLVGIRNVETGEQLSYAEVIEYANRYNVKHTNVVDTTLDKLLNSLDDKRADEAEGFVIDIDGFKLKLKYNDYVQLHHMIAKYVSPNAIIRSISDGTWDDLKSKIPEAYRADAEIIAKEVFHYAQAMDAYVKKQYHNIMHDEGRIVSENAIDDRKNFSMLALSKYKDVAHYLICMYDNKEYSYIHNRANKYLKIAEIRKFNEYLANR